MKPCPGYVPVTREVARESGDASEVGSSESPSEVAEFDYFYLFVDLYCDGQGVRRAQHLEGELRCREIYVGIRDLNERRQQDYTLNGNFETVNGPRDRTTCVNRKTKIKAVRFHSYGFPRFQPIHSSAT